jgi:carbon-monoxide dehydrogenase small subunit
MTVYELLRDSPTPNDDEIRDALGGQICRCTGYQAILKSVHRAASKLRDTEPARETPRSADGA